MIEQSVNQKKKYQDKKAYALPLAPQDLVDIYKQKENDKEFVLWVDYAKSREKLTAKNILIYLSNTNFKCHFSEIDEDLIIEYIKSDFMVDCSLLARFTTMCIKTRLQYEFNVAEKQLTFLISEDKIIEIVENNLELIDELCNTLSQLIAFVLHKFYNELPDDIREKEVNIKPIIEEIEIIDKPVSCGVNVLRIVTDAWDAFLLITSRFGFTKYFNKQIYNDKPTYFGSDLYYVLVHTRIVENILKMMPPGTVVVSADDSPSE